VDVTLPLAQMALEEDEPILRIVAAGLYMAWILLAPAVVEAAQRGCLAVRRHFAVTRVARIREGEFPGEPSARWGSDEASPFQDYEWFVDRDIPG
jgi:hypothetical protein